MRKHLKFALFLVAIALVAALIFSLKTQESYGKQPAVEKLFKTEFLGIKLPDIFLGVLGLAFVGITAGYVVSLLKGGAEKRKGACEAESREGAVPAAQAPPRKLILEKALGKAGSKILSVLLVCLLILVVLAVLIVVVYMLFPDIPVLRDLFIGGSVWPQ